MFRGPNTFSIPVWMWFGSYEIFQFDPWQQPIFSKILGVDDVSKLHVLNEFICKAVNMAVQTHVVVFTLKWLGMMSFFGSFAKGAKALEVAYFTSIEGGWSSSRWWFHMFFPYTWGHEPIWLIFFQMGGWFNHQLESIWSWPKR